MNKLLKILSTMATAVAVASCGGGGPDAGTPPFGTGSGGAAGCSPTTPASGSASSPSATPCVTAASLSLTLSTASIDNSGGQTVTATATAVTASGQALAGIPVTFAVDNGATFTQSGSSTGANGQSTAVVSIGSDPSNRLVKVTATSGTLVAEQVFAVTGASLTGTRLPAIVTPGSTGNKVDFRLIDANGKAIVGLPITVTAGSLGTTTGTTGSNGDYSFVYTAPGTTGALEVAATAGGVSNTQIVSVQASASSVPAASCGTSLPGACPVSSASVSANPSVVTTNTATTNNRTEVRALFVGGNNATIKNVRVRFDLNGDPSNIGGQFSTGTNIVYSDDNGIATTAYIPGTRSSPTNGVTIRACYDTVDFAASACPNAATTTITIASDPLSVTIGSNSEIIVGSLTYKRQFVVLVVDASGSAKANVDIVSSIDIDTFYKGEYFRPTGATRWARNLPVASCANEDVNRNGVLEAGEDKNNSGSLEPRKSDVAVTILGTGKTDASGTATVQIEYPQNIGSWARVKILIAATGISGTEGRATWTEVLPVPESALTAATLPPFAESPYGIVDFVMDPTTFSSPAYPEFPISVFPNGLPIPSAALGICNNPY